MRVKCVGVDPEAFQVGEALKSHYRKWVGQGGLFDSVKVGTSYVVYAVSAYSGHVFFYTRYLDRPTDWMMVPALCFEIIDPRVSKYWRYGFKVLNSASEETIVSTFAIKEWVEEPNFFERLADGKNRELAVMTKAAMLMDEE